MARNSAAYDEDFYAWTQEQARLLRSGEVRSADVENVAEEIESMGRSDKRELECRLAVLLAHLLKWQFQPAQRSASWQHTMVERRRRIARLLKESPSLAGWPDTALAEVYADAREDAALEAGLAVETLPATCPYAIDQILDRRFLPEATA